MSADRWNLIGYRTLPIAREITGTPWARGVNEPYKALQYVIGNSILHSAHDKCAQGKPKAKCEYWGRAGSSSKHSAVC